MKKYFSMMWESISLIILFTAAAGLLMDFLYGIHL